MPEGWLAPGVVAPRPAAAVPEVASPLSLETRQRCMGSMINPNCGKNIMGRNDDGPQLWMDGLDGLDGLWVIYFWTKLV